MPADGAGRYAQIIERIFHAHHESGVTSFEFDRDEFNRTAVELGLPPPKNLGDIIYTFRYRRPLPESVQSLAPEGQSWVITLAGGSRYRFSLRTQPTIVPNPALAETKIPDGTPGVIQKYALTDEQALLAKVRYNRLVDIFTGVACYSLQSHLRTQVPGLGQVETDEIYIGIDRRGAQYVFPVQAKGGRDILGIVQIEQDLALCEDKFPSLVCRPIGAQFVAGDLIAMFEFVPTDEGVKIDVEKHYRLVPPDEITPDDLVAYGRGG